MSIENFLLVDETLGMKARLARIARRWRQVDLAYFADVAQHQVSALERDAPVYPASRERILAALGLEQTP